jgi:hypothetical protein
MKQDDKIFHQLLQLVNKLSIFAFALILIALVYIPLKPSIDAYLNKPKYSKSELAEMLRKRENSIAREKQNDPDRVENGIHILTGLIYDENLNYIKRHCISCHSPKLIAQNKSTRTGWKQMIEWMQNTQGLHDLGADETFVLDYLSKNYAPNEVGRRPNLDVSSIEWYELTLD